MMSSKAVCLPGWLAVLVCFLLPSCVSSDKRIATAPDVAFPSARESQYELLVSYDEKRRAFKFELRSLTNETICMSRMAWPEGGGRHYLFGDNSVYFVENGIRYYLRDIPTGFCSSAEVLGCQHVVQPGERLVGWLSIKDFDVPSGVFLADRFSPALEYPIRPVVCSRSP